MLFILAGTMVVRLQFTHHFKKPTRVIMYSLRFSIKTSFHQAKLGGLPHLTPGRKFSVFGTDPLALHRHFGAQPILPKLVRHVG